MTKREVPRCKPRHLLHFLAVAISTAFLVAPAAAQLSFQTLQTRYLRVAYYDQDHAYIIPYLGRCFENSMSYYRTFFDYTPSEEVTVFLQDFDDYGYAGTSTIPNNYITLGIEPFEYVYETCPTNERFNWVVSHELVHVIVSEKGVGADLFWRKAFHGKVGANAQNPESILYSYLTNPRRYAPRWYHEGIAVFMETWLAGGVGRALGGYDEMVFRTMVDENAYFYDVVGLESEGTTSDFQIGQNSYLYGTRFMSYLALTYSPEQVIDWVNRREGSHASYVGQFKMVFSKSLHDVWRDWIVWEHQWQSDNLAAIREYTVTEERPIVSKPLGSASRGFYDADSRTFYAAVNYPGSFAHIAAINVDTGSIRNVCDVQTPALYYVTSLAFDPESGTLFYTTNNGKHWRDLNAIDVRTGTARRLITNNRTGDLVFNRVDRSIWGVQHHNGRSALVRIEAPWDGWDRMREVMVLPFGRDLFDIDISPDGRFLTGSMIDVTGGAKLIRLDIAGMLAGDAGYDVLHEFTNTAPANFVYSPDGSYLYGTSYMSGVSNIFRYSFESGLMEAVTNCETGYFRPVVLSDDSLLVYRYVSDGLMPVVVPLAIIEDVNAVRYLGNAVVEAHPVVKDWKLGSPRAVDIDSLTLFRGQYNKIRSLGVASLYPIAEGYKDYGSFGLRLNFMDPLGLHGGEVAATVSPLDAVPDDEKVHARVSYRSFPWNFAATYNRSDFYDFFGPTRTSRKGYAASITRNDYFIADNPRVLEYTVSVAYYAGLDEVPYAQDVAATYDALGTTNASLSYRNTRRTIGAVEVEKGISWSLDYEGDLVKQDFYSKFQGHLDVGVPTPIDHSSLWTRLYGGYSFGDNTNSFANFYFGGFGNNYVDHREVKRYREEAAFPGSEISSVNATRYGKAMLEWTLPPVRFERVGIPAMYTTWMRTALFTSFLAADVGPDTARRDLLSAGLQVDFRVVMFSGFEWKLSMGYAGSFEEGRTTDREFMISLNIL